MNFIKLKNNIINVDTIKYIKEITINNLHYINPIVLQHTDIDVASFDSSYQVKEFINVRIFFDNTTYLDINDMSIEEIYNIISKKSSTETFVY